MKTLDECKGIVARKHGFLYWQSVLTSSNVDLLFTEVAELYASQSKPKQPDLLERIKAFLKDNFNGTDEQFESAALEFKKEFESFYPQSKPQEIEWLSSEIKPESDKPVLAIIESGKYPVRVMWVKEHSISTEDWEFHGAEYYNESDDKYYWPEGWYEWNEMEEVHWMCKDVLFWTELPIYDKSELKTRIKPVDTKTVDAVEFAEWLKVNNHELKLDSGYRSDEHNAKLLNLYKQDIESKR